MSSLPPDGEIRLEFSEGVDPGTLSGNVLLSELVNGAEVPVAGQVKQPEFEPWAVVFVPAAPLVQGATYRLKAVTGIIGKSGKTLRRANI